MWSGTTSLPQGQARCRACRRLDWQHGTRKGYRDNACRCDMCAAWNRASAAKQRQRVRAGLRDSSPCSDPTCARPSAARGMCVMHYHRWARGSGKAHVPSDTWNDNRRSNSQARRARKQGARNTDRVLLAHLLERDGATCTYCGEHIDIDLPWPEPLSVSVDHTTPLSRGGTHTMGNTTVMHLRCNLRKGTKILNGAADDTRLSEGEAVPLHHP